MEAKQGDVTLLSFLLTPQPQTRSALSAAPDLPDVSDSLRVNGFAFAQHNRTDGGTDHGRRPRPGEPASQHLGVGGRRRGDELTAKPCEVRTLDVKKEQ